LRFATVIGIWGKNLEQFGAKPKKNFYEFFNDFKISDLQVPDTIYRFRTKVVAIG
jgi:hypothetical protein